MKNDAENINVPEQAVCGQAHAVFDILARTGNLPTELSLSIEEILERAWEIAYRRRRDAHTTSITDLAAFRALRERNTPSDQTPSL